MKSRARAVACLQGYRTAPSRLSHPRRSGITSARREEGPPRRTQPRDDPARVSARTSCFRSNGTPRIRHRFEARNDLLPPRQEFAFEPASPAFFDPYPPGTALNVTFRRWKGVLPFDAILRERLGQDRAQKRMQSIDLVPEPDFREAVRLATRARETFTARFDVSVWLA